MYEDFDKLLEAFMIACYTYDHGRIEEARKKLKDAVQDLRWRAERYEYMDMEKRRQGWAAKAREADLFARRLAHVGD